MDLGQIRSISERNDKARLCTNERNSRGTIEKMVLPHQNFIQQYYCCLTKSKRDLSSPPKGHKFSDAQQRFYEEVQVEFAQLCALTCYDLKPCIKARLDRGYGSRLGSSHEYLETGGIIQYLTVPDLDQCTFIELTCFLITLSRKGRVIYARTCQSR